MDDPLYRENIMEHWERPRNYGVVEGADVDITSQNPVCGDEMRITARTVRNKIVDIKFVANGCAISKAAASMLTEQVKGMSSESFLKMKPEKFLENFEGGLTPVRTKCALLGFTILRRAVSSKLK